MIKLHIPRCISHYGIDKWAEREFGKGVLFVSTRSLFGALMSGRWHLWNRDVVLKGRNIYPHEFTPALFVAEEMGLKSVVWFLPRDPDDMPASLGNVRADAEVLQRTIWEPSNEVATATHYAPPDGFYAKRLLPAEEALRRVRRAAIDRESWVSIYDKTNE